MISIKVKAPDLTKLRNMDVVFHTQLVDQVKKAVANAEYISKRDYLSGPNYRGAKNPTPGPEGVLGWKTGHLKGSVRALPVEDGHPIRGTLAAGPLVYAAIHEFGGEIHRQSTAMGLRGRISSAMLAGHYTIRVPKRSYLQPALKRTVENLKQAIWEIVRGLRI
jgi:phage gpG-like protein